MAALTRTPLSGFPAAVRALDWSGHLLPDVLLLGTRAAMVVGVDRDAHARRATAGCGPVLDYDTLAIWEWPESAGRCPPSPVRLAGVLAVAQRSAEPAEPAWSAEPAGGRAGARAGGRPAGRSVRRAVGVARRWTGFGPAAVLLPAGVDPPSCRLECGYAGVGVVALGAGDEPARLLQPGRAGRAERSRRRTLDRWVEEQLYRRLLDSGTLD